MNDEQDTLRYSTSPSAQHVHSGVLVAVATLVLAGSAVFWRSNLRLGNIRLLPNIYGSEQRSALDEHNGQHEANECTSPDDGSKSQISRSKERRKRRKDPMKELLKGGKKSKDLAKLLKQIDLPGTSGQSMSSAPGPQSISEPSQEPSNSIRPVNLKRNRSTSRSDFPARDPSASCSSRSVSVSSTGKTSTKGPSGDDDGELNEEELQLTAIPPSPAPPTNANPGHSPSTSYDSTPSIAASTYSFDSAETADTSVQSATYLDLDPALDEPGPSSSKNTLRNKFSNSDNSTNNHNDNTTTDSSILFTSQSMPSTSILPYTKEKHGGSSSSTLKAIPSSSISSSPSRTGQPPRFHSQTRQEQGTRQANQASGIGPRLGPSTSMPIYSTNRASSSTSKLGAEYTNEESFENVDRPVPFSFPSLNTSGSRSGSGSGSGSGLESGAGSSKANSVAGAYSPPSGSTNSTSLSTQTQIASLRGALEASRRREEEAKGRDERTRSELERLNNELKMLRWEGNVWRQREGELHAQIHQLVHQVQSYAAYYVPPGPSHSQPPHSQSIPQPQKPNVPPQQMNGKHSLGKRAQLQGQASTSSATSSRSTSKSSRPSHSSHASPVPSMTPLPEAQTQTHTQESSSPSKSSPIPPHRMFSPSTVGSSSTTYLPHMAAAPFSPSSPFGHPGMFSPISPAGMPFSSPPLGAAGMLSPLSLSMQPSPHSPYFQYPPYHDPNQNNGNGNTSGKMHPMQFLNILNTGANSHAGTAEGMDSSVSSSSMSSVPSGTDSTGSMSPDPTVSPTPAPGHLRERGRKRGRGGAVSGLNDRSMGYGYGYDYPYGYSYPYPQNLYPYSGVSPQGISEEGLDQGSERKVEESVRAGNDEDYESESEDEGEGVNEILAGAILKRPESMMSMGLGSSSASGRSSKSNSKVKRKLKLKSGSQPNLAALSMEEDKNGKTASGEDDAYDAEEAKSLSTESGLGSGLDWIKDPGLFRREATPAQAENDAEATVVMKSQPNGGSNVDFVMVDTNDIDPYADNVSSSSSSAKSTSTPESPTEPIEFTFPSISTWGYSYQTHSAVEADKKASTENPPVLDDAFLAEHEETASTGEEEAETTQPATKAPLAGPSAVGSDDEHRETTSVDVVNGQ